MRKTLISVNGYNDQGKTLVVNNLIKLILQDQNLNALIVSIKPDKHTPQSIISNWNTINATANVNAVISVMSISGIVKIGIESEGDVSWKVINSLNEFVKENCDLIICCNHPSNTCNAKLYIDNEMHVKYGYRIFRTSNYSLPKIHHQNQNQIFNGILNTHSTQQIFDTIDAILKGRI